ncbi:MAG: hypothetical protein DCF30_10570 [Hyphomicrobiales bacterium]|nr:MAG: hypothetical protein DCF30_10570 [Hyphomicrobiales bacterium]
MGGPVASLVLQISASRRRVTTIYSLIAFGGLVTIFAAGYALDAVRTKLMFQFGGVLASAIIAGGLIVMAGCLVGTAIAIKNRAPASSSQTASFTPDLPYPKSYSQASLAAAAGALTAAVIVARSRAVRAFMARHPRP